MTTKEIILQQALILFAEKGYDGVSVREIAKAVGVRESALYKHYKNKEDIFMHVIEVTKNRITESYVSNQIPETINKEDISGGYKLLSIDKICNMAWNLFCMYTKDPMVSNFRKLLMREQYSNPGIAKYYNDIFLDGAIENLSHTFEELVKGKMFKEVDPRIIALHFYGPIFMLFQLYDCSPEKEDDIKKTLILHVKTFGENFTKSEVQ